MRTFKVIAGSVLMAGCAVNHGAEVAGLSDSQRDMDILENRIGGFIVKMAQADARNLDEISQILGAASWHRSNSSKDEVLGWIDQVAIGVNRFPWLQRTTYEYYVKEVNAADGGTNITCARLMLELKDGVCFSGEQLNRKYQKASVEEAISSRPVHGSARVVPLSIADKEVLVQYARERECVSQVTITWTPEIARQN